MHAVINIKQMKSMIIYQACEMKQTLGTPEISYITVSVTTNAYRIFSNTFVNENNSIYIKISFMIVPSHGILQVNISTGNGLAP